MGQDDRVSIDSTDRPFSDGNDEPEGCPAPALKRRRIGLACSPCRLRKSRCNGIRPKCSPCERLGFECIYEVPDTSANLLVPKDIFAALENQLKDLEATVKQHSARLASIEANGSRDGPQSSPITANVTHMSNSSSIVVSLEGLQDPPADRSMTDGMAISFVDEQDCGFFGPSSNIALMRHIFRAVAKKGALAQDTATPPSSSNFGLYHAGMVNISRPISPVVNSSAHDKSQDIQTNILPPPLETERLINAYFSNTGLLFPFIHKETFLETYHTIRSNNFRGDLRRTWLGLLNMILAMAVCTANPTRDDSNHLQQSDVYFKRAQELCKTQILRGTTLEIVQFLLLMSQYLQGTQKSVQTWNTHGLAVKAALSIGLHSRNAMARFPPLEQEMRKRTWFGCVLLDRSLSMTFGRPGLIPEDYVKLELPKPFPHLERSLTGDQDASILFFNSSIRLYQIVWKTAGTLYGHNLGCDEPPAETQLVTEILNLEQDLDNWRHSLPSSMSLRSASSLLHRDRLEDLVMERFRMILSLRYLNLQLLIYRPMLTISLSTCHSTNSQMMSNRGSLGHMQMSFNRTGIQAAEDIIEIIYTVLTDPGLGKNLIGAWWFTLYYAFNAALSIFGGLLIPLDDNNQKSGKFERLDRGRCFLEKAVTGLGHLGPGNPVLDRSVSYLKQLHGLVEEWAGSTSPRTLDLGAPGSFLDPFSTASDINKINFSIDPVSGTRLPMLDSEISNFDELELGNYFASQSYHWF